ncbi:hypothetical protein CONPUDRAFT_133903 [Coniophora puteana RWD-64-598 SS2]|uniref:Uncharacterized protein n=1 Tax=Coniophora puteana (strain RWD-64-598) TaxID=741705 RepID=A0A5M3N599_CONPW|nr:uncharacterized protein CONPUDRAFT_133903 [Coniophora puteana RWD-64-598 SS2]EIW86478.1 hypothetical protein CONPUDRAFT_133903 [Coniophora puteana RWD-64-598 SS2]
MSAKSVTRSTSIRQSIGKAFADVMNKDREPHQTSPTDKPLKKPRESSSGTRRLSALHAMQSAIPHSATASSRLDAPGPAHPAKDARDQRAKEDGMMTDTATTAKTLTRTSRRRSAIPSAEKTGPGHATTDEGKKTPEAPAHPPARRASLRPRTSQGTSALPLPKYRPRSVLADDVKDTAAAKRSAIPVKPPVRRQTSSSDDDKDEDSSSPGASKGKLLDSQATDDDHDHSRDRKGRISPLSHSTLAVKVSLPGSAPPTTTTIDITPTRKGGKVSPSQPPKSKSKLPATKPPTRSSTTPSSATPPSTIGRHAAAVPRRSSISSGRPTPSPHGSTSKATSSSLLKASTDSHKSTPLRKSPLRQSSQPPESPLARRSRNGSDSTLGPRTPGQSSRDADSEDSTEADDVELLLAPVASPDAPTPSIPRTQTHRRTRTDQPEFQTPTKATDGMPRSTSYSHSPLILPKGSDPSPRHLRPLQGVERGSILSWDQMAKDASKLLSPDEVGHMLHDVPAPFTPGPASPMMTAVLGLESPNLCPLPSPGDFASISQVLLPEVTPSPAVHHQTFDHTPNGSPGIDLGTVTRLRLQIAFAENLASERLERLQDVEEQLQRAQHARAAEAEDLAAQLAALQQQLHGSVEARERREEDHAAYTLSLEDQLRHAEAARDGAVQAAVARAQEEARRRMRETIGGARVRWDAVQVAQTAGLRWEVVRDKAEADLGDVKADRATLQVLLGMLEQSRRRVRGMKA